MKKDNKYIFNSLIIIILSGIFFLFFKGILPEKILSAKAVTENVMVDSLFIKEVAKSANKVDSTENINDSIISDSIANTTEDENIVLKDFFTALLNLEKDSTSKVRIAYFGDSMIDGDLIVQDLREHYHSKYGGEGVGFIPIESESDKSKISIRKEIGEGWISESFLHLKNNLLGVSGRVSYRISKEKTSIRINAGNIATMNMLNNPTIYYGKSQNKYGISSYVENSNIVTIKLNPTNILNKTVIYNGNKKNITIKLENSDNIPFYGLDFSSSRGVTIDNFGVRGNSGLPLSILNKDLMNKFQEYLKYNLIIIHYGANVLSNRVKTYSWYRNKMKSIVEHLKECFPGASFLIISTADKSIKGKDNTMVTDSTVYGLLKSQKEYADITQSGFLNLFESMGGDGSMVKWVKEFKPARANKDYTHFNGVGAKIVSSYIFDFLEKEFKEYKENKLSKK